MLKHPFVKKFLFIYLTAVVLVVLYFISKMLFTQEKEIELKQFNTTKQEVKAETKEDQLEPKRKFILLPKSN